jgi:transposase
MADKSAELVEGLVARSPPSGRRTYNVAAKRALVQLCQRPGVSVAGTALAHGINANLLRRWMTQYGNESKPANGTSPGASLLPVNTAAAPGVRVAQPLDCSIEFSFMNTTIRVRGAVDARALSVVLDCLAQRA